jgi:hypothetical protein
MAWGRGAWVECPRCLRVPRRSAPALGDARGRPTRVMRRRWWYRRTPREGDARVEMASGLGAGVYSTAFFQRLGRVGLFSCGTSAQIRWRVRGCRCVDIAPAGDIAPQLSYQSAREVRTPRIVLDASSAAAASQSRRRDSSRGRRAPLHRAPLPPAVLTRPQTASQPCSRSCAAVTQFAWRVGTSEEHNTYLYPLPHLVAASNADLRRNVHRRLNRTAKGNTPSPLPSTPTKPRNLSNFFFVNSDGLGRWQKLRPSSGPTPPAAPPPPEAPRRRHRGYRGFGCFFHTDVNNHPARPSPPGTEMRETPLRFDFRR